MKRRTLLLASPALLGLPGLTHAQAAYPNLKFHPQKAEFLQ